MVRNTSTNAKCGNEALVFIFSFIHEGYTSTANDPLYEIKRWADAITGYINKNVFLFNLYIDQPTS